MPPPQVGPLQTPSSSAQAAASPYAHHTPVLGGGRPMGTPNMSAAGQNGGLHGHGNPHAHGHGGHPHAGHTPQGNGIAMNTTYSGSNHGNSSGGGAGVGAAGNSANGSNGVNLGAMPGPSSVPANATPAAAVSHAGGGPSAATAGTAASIGALFPPGAAVLRMMQMYDAMSGKGTLNEGKMLHLDYWRSFVHEFFVPDGCYRNIVWNPQAREQRAFGEWQRGVTYMIGHIS